MQVDVGKDRRDHPPYGVSAVALRGIHEDVRAAKGHVFPAGGA